MSCDFHGLGSAVCAATCRGITVAAVSTAKDVARHTYLIGNSPSVQSSTFLAFKNEWGKNDAGSQAAGARNSEEIRAVAEF